MSITYKLVGSQLQIRKDFEGFFNYNILYHDAMQIGIDKEDFQNIKFITESEQIKDNDKIFQVDKDNERIIHVFSPDESIRDKLRNSFLIHGSLKEQSSSHVTSKKEDTEEIGHPIQYVEIDEEITKPITVVKKEAVQITDEIIETMNKKFVSLIEDSDFLALNSIYIRRPDMFKVFSQFVQHGTIIQESAFSSKEHTEEEIQSFVELAKNIPDIVPQEIKMKHIIKHNGHLNLAFRSIMTDNQWMKS